MIKRLLMISLGPFVSFSLDQVRRRRRAPRGERNNASRGRTRRQRKVRDKQGRVDQEASTRILEGNKLHVWCFLINGTCMSAFGSLVVIGMGFARCDNGFNLSFLFPDSHGVMGFFYLVELWISIWFWNWVSGLRKIPKGLGIPWPVLVGLQ